MKTRMKAVSVFLVFTLLHSNILQAMDFHACKLASRSRVSELAALIGKIVNEKGEIITEYVEGEIRENYLYLWDRRDPKKKPIAKIRCEREYVKEEMSGELNRLFSEQNLQKDSIEARYIREIIEYSTSAEAKFYILKEDIRNIYGFANERFFCLYKPFLIITAAFFHEAGESFFKSNRYRKFLSQELGRELNDEEWDNYKGKARIIADGNEILIPSHTYLRGLGKKARAGTRALTDVEKLLPQGEGLEDLLFGEENIEVSQMMREQKEIKEELKKLEDEEWFKKMLPKLRKFADFFPEQTDQEIVLFIKEVIQVESISKLLDLCLARLLMPNNKSRNLDINLFRCIVLLGDLLEILHRYVPYKKIANKILERAESIIKEMKKTAGEQRSLEKYRKGIHVMKALVRFFKRIEKADIHHHLDGSISPRVALRVLWEYPKLRESFVRIIMKEKTGDVDQVFRTRIGGLDDPKSIENLKPFIEYKYKGEGEIDWMEFFAKFNLFYQVLNTGLDAVKFVAREASLEDYYNDAVSLVEHKISIITPGLELDPAKVLKAVISGLIEAEEITGGKLKTGLIPCIWKDPYFILDRRYEEIKQTAETDKRTPEQVKADILKELPQNENTEFQEVCGEVERQIRRDTTETNENKMNELIKQQIIILFEARKEALRQVQILVDLKKKWERKNPKYASYLIGLDTVGDEKNYIRWVTNSALSFASQNGFMITEHLGENWHPGELKYALIRIKKGIESGVKRIGHATALGIDTQKLVWTYKQEEIAQISALQKEIKKMIREKGIHIETNPSSNVLLIPEKKLKLIEGYTDIPIAGFYMELGNVSINTDDSWILHTIGLSGEFAKIWLAHPYLTFGDINKIINNGFEASFRKEYTGLPRLIVNDPSVTIKRDNTGGFILAKGEKELVIKKLIYNDCLFMQIGSRVYEVKKGIQVINLEDLLKDPLLWIGNAELINFFGEDAIMYPEGPRGPPCLMLVEWNEELRKHLPEPKSADRKIIELAYARLQDPKFDPILKAHYALVVYFFDISYDHASSRSYKQEPGLPVSSLDIISNISEQRVNEFIYSLLGIRNVIVPHIVSIQFRKFHAILKRLCDLYNAEKLTTDPITLLDENSQNIVVSRLNSILIQIEDYEISNFKSIEQINNRFNTLTKEKIDLFSYNQKAKAIVIRLGTIFHERRVITKRRGLYVFRKRGPPGIDRDTVVVEALAFLCKTRPHDTVNRICGAINGWSQDWAVNTVLQGAASNFIIKLENPIRSTTSNGVNPMDEFFKKLKLGVGRSGWGLGGASVETETWCRDVFTNFIGTIKIIAGVDRDGKPYIAKQVYFGPKVDKEKDCTGEPLIDAYNYRRLCNALFSGEPLTKEVIEPLLKGTDITAGDGEDFVGILQRIYDYYIEKTKEALKKWILENNLRIVMFGQVALPNENPVFYPALLGVLEEINRDRKSDERVVAFLRHNYFRKKWKIRDGIRMRIIQKDDPVEIFVESETNADIFENYFGFRPSVLYEAVHFPEIDGSSKVTFREQIREMPDIKEAVINFKRKLESASQDKEPVDLDNDIIITQPSRIDMNKRPDSTIALAKNIQKRENAKADKERRKPRKVRVLFLGSEVRLGPEGTTDISGTEREALNLIQRMAKEGGIDISNQIYFLGYVPQKEVIAGMTFTHIMSQASDRETFGRTPMEAMATGVPIIYCRDWTYPFDPEDRQVFYPLFGGNRIFTLRPGSTSKEDGKWIPGEVQPDSEPGEIPVLHRYIYYTLNEPDNMESMARLNFYLSRRSMFNLKNLENFLKLRFIAYFDTEGKRLKFKHRGIIDPDLIRGFKAERTAAGKDSDEAAARKIDQPYATTILEQAV